MRGPWILLAPLLAVAVGYLPTFNPAAHAADRKSNSTQQVLNLPAETRAKVLGGKPNAAINPATAKAVQQMRLSENLKYTLKVPFDPGAAKSNAPSGPDPSKATVNLALALDTGTGRLEQDFARRLRWSEILIPDHSSPSTWYYFPREYLLKREGTAGGSGYKLKFNYRLLDADAAEDSVKMEFELAAPYLPGDTVVLKRLAQRAIKPSDGKQPDLRPLQIRSVRVQLDGLESFIPPESIKILNSPSFVGDDIKVEATMSESIKEELVSELRNMGISGNVVIETLNGEIPIPLSLGFRNFSGPWFSEVRDMGAGRPLKNLSPFPVAIKGVVSYVVPRNNRNTVERTVKTLADVNVVPPGAERESAFSHAQLFANAQTVLATWVDFDAVTACDACLNEIEKEILAVPSVLSKSQFNLEAIPSLFDQFELFKIVVEVRSRYFSSGADWEETRNFTLRPDETATSAWMYLDRDLDYDAVKYHYRMRPVRSDGAPTGFSAWEPSSSMDLTVTPYQIEPLVSRE